MNRSAPLSERPGRVQRLVAALGLARRALWATPLLLGPLLLTPTPVQADSLTGTVVYNVAGTCKSGTGFDGTLTYTNTSTAVASTVAVTYTATTSGLASASGTAFNVSNPIRNEPYDGTYNGGNVNAAASTGAGFAGRVVANARKTISGATTLVASVTVTGASYSYDETGPGNSWLNKTVSPIYDDGTARVNFTMSSTDLGCAGGPISWTDNFGVGNAWSDSTSPYTFNDFYTNGANGVGVGSTCLASNSFSATMTSYDRFDNPNSTATSWTWNGQCIGVVSNNDYSTTWRSGGVSVTTSNLTSVSSTDGTYTVTPSVSFASGSAVTSYTETNVGTAGLLNKQPTCYGRNANVKYKIGSTTVTSWSCPWTLYPFELSDLTWARKSASVTNIWYYTGSQQGPGTAGAASWCRGTNGTTGTSFYQGDTTGGFAWPSGIFAMGPTNLATAVGNYTATCSVNQNNTNITNGNIVGAGVSTTAFGDWAIQLNDQTTALTATATTLAYGTNGVQNTPTVTIAGGNGTGAYQFNTTSPSATPLVCTVSNISGATATLTFLSGSPGQACRVNARRLGDSNYNSTAYTAITVNSGGLTVVQKGSQATLTNDTVTVPSLQYGWLGSNAAGILAGGSAWDVYKAKYALGFPSTTFDAGGGAWSAVGSASQVSIRGVPRVANAICTGVSQSGNTYASYLAGSPTLADGGAGECWLSVSRAGDANWNALSATLVRIKEAGSNVVLISKGSRGPMVGADSFFYGIAGARLNDRTVAPRGVLSTAATDCPTPISDPTAATLQNPCGFGAGSSATPTFSTAVGETACRVNGGRLAIDEVGVNCLIGLSIPADTNWQAYNAATPLVGRNGPLGTEAYTNITQKGTQAPLAGSAIDVLSAGATSSVASDSPRTTFNFATALDGWSGSGGADVSYVASSSMTNAAGSGLLVSKPASVAVGDQIVATVAVSAVPYIKGVGALASGTTSLSITPPTNGIGDTVIVFVESTQVTTAIGTPTATGATFAPIGTAGGVAVGASNNAAGSSRFGVWWARATSGAIGAISVAHAGSGQMVGYAVVVANAASSPLGAVSGPTAVSVASATATFDPITTTAPDSLVFTALATDADGTTAQVSTTGAAGNLSNYNFLASGSTATGQGGGLAIAAGALGATGSSGSPTLPLVNSQVHVRTTFEIKAAGTASLAPSEPAKWTTLAAPTRVGPLWSALYTRTAAADDTGYNFVTSSGGAVISAVALDVFRGVDVASPTLGAGATDSSSATITSPAVSPDRDDMLRVVSGVTMTPGSLSLPGGFTSSSSINQAPGLADGFGLALYSARSQLTSGAAQPSVSATATATDTTAKGWSGRGFSVLLRPASANSLLRDIVYPADGGVVGSLKTTSQPGSFGAGSVNTWTWTGSFTELGVPPEGTITALTVSAKSKAVGAFGATPSTIAKWEYLYGANATVLSAGRSVSSADAAFVSTGTLSGAPVGSRSPADSFSLRITDTLVPSTSGSTSLDVYHDTIVVTVTYTLPVGASSCPGSGCRLLYGIDGTVAAYSLVFSGGSAGATGLDNPELTITAPSPSACSATQLNPATGLTDTYLAIARPTTVSLSTACRLTVGARTDDFWAAGDTLTISLGYVTKGEITVAPDAGIGETGKGDIVPNCTGTSTPTLACGGLVGSTGVLEVKSSAVPYAGAAASFTSTADPANSELACLVPATVAGTTLTASGAERRAFYRVPNDASAPSGGTICYVTGSWLESTLWLAGPVGDPVPVFAVGGAAQDPISLLVGGVAVSDYDTVSYGGTPPTRRALALAGGSGPGAVGFDIVPLPANAGICSVQTLVGGSYEIELLGPGLCTVSAWKEKSAAYNRIDASFVFEVIPDDQEDPLLGGAPLVLSGDLVTASTVTLTVTGGTGGGSFDTALSFGAGCPVGIDSSRSSQTLGASPQATYLVTVPAASAGIQCEVTYGRDGDARYARATGSSTLTIARIPTTVTIAPQAEATTTSGNRTINVTIEGSEGPLTVTAPLAGNDICRPSGGVTRTVNATTNTASFALAFPGSSGSCTVTVSVAIEDDYAAGTATLSFDVAKTDQTITFAAIPDRALSDTRTFTVPASASSGLTPSLASSTASVCTVDATPASGSAPGPFSYTVTVQGATGVCTLTANQAGNGTYNAASEVSQSFTVTQPVPGALDLLATSDSGRYDNDNITNEAGLEIVGDLATSSGFGAISSSALRVTIRAELQCGPGSGTPVASCLAQPTNWESTVALLGAGTNGAGMEWTHEFGSLPEGVYKIRAQTRSWNGLGLVSPAFDSPWSEPLTVIVDRSVPTPPNPTTLGMTSGQPGALRTFLTGFPQVFYDPTGVVGSSGQMSVTFSAEDSISGVDQLLITDPDPISAPSMLGGNENTFEPSALGDLETIRAASFTLPLSFSNATIGSSLLVYGRDLAGNSCNDLSCALRLTFTPDGVAPTAVFKSGSGESFGPLVTLYRSVLSFTLRSTLIDKGNSSGPGPLN